MEVSSSPGGASDYGLSRSTWTDWRTSSVRCPYRSPMDLRSQHPERPQDVRSRVCWSRPTRHLQMTSQWCLFLRPSYSHSSLLSNSVSHREFLLLLASFLDTRALVSSLHFLRHLMHRLLGGFAQSPLFSGFGSLHRPSSPADPGAGIVPDQKSQVCRIFPCPSLKMQMVALDLNLGECSLKRKRKSKSN